MVQIVNDEKQVLSLLSRGAWIEIQISTASGEYLDVAPLTRSVD